MTIIHNSYDTLFLDIKYLHDLEIIARKERLIENLFSCDDNELPIRKPNNYKTLLFLIMMYDHLDSSISDYSWDTFVSEGIIKPDACIINGYGGFANGKEDIQCIKKAKEISLFYKDDLIKEILSRAKKLSGRKLSDLYFYDDDEFRKRFGSSVTFLGDLFGTLPGKYSLSNDFEKVFDGLIDDNLKIGLSPNDYKKGKSFGLLHHHMLEPIDYFYNLIDSLHCSQNSNIVYKSSIFEFPKTRSKITDVEKIYNTQIHFISELQVIPMPATLKEAFKFRKDPNLISFKTAMNEWISYIDNGEYNLAEKMKKDLIKANNALEHIGRFKRINNHPVTICFKFVGSVLLDLLVNKSPVATVLTPATESIGAVVLNYLEDKNKWSLLVKE